VNAVKTIFKRALPLLLCAAAASFGANLANPAAQAGTARMYFGASYFVGGSDITNLEIPMIMNRLNMRVGYAPVSYVNFGADLGLPLISVEEYNRTPVFDGDFGWSAGGHLKLSTPYILGRVAVLALGNINVFRSTNKGGAYYGGTDLAAAGGLQFKLPARHCLSLGPQFYMIMGKNKGFEEKTEGTYSNVNNMRAWLAYEYLPADVFGGEYKPYMSLELTASPKICASKRVPVKEFSVSVSVGIITKRLYGEGKADDD
jgi:hypothetical protein